MERTPARYRAAVKVVIADADTYMGQGLRNALTSEGYQDVRVVARCFALRDVMLATMADLLVLDADLPDGDAIAFVREVRHGRIGRNPFLPIILVTWANDPAAVQRAVNSGVDLILELGHFVGSLVRVVGRDLVVAIDLGFLFSHTLHGIAQHVLGRPAEGSALALRVPGHDAQVAVHDVEADGQGLQGGPGDAVAVVRQALEL